MAVSAGHMLHNQKVVIETQLKRAINQTLKDICRDYGKAVSGNKAELQRRCIDILNDIAARGDPLALDGFKYRLSHPGQAPPGQALHSPASNYGSPAPNHNHYSMAPGRGNFAVAGRPSSSKYFKPSPFYEIVDTVLPLADIPAGRAEMPQNRNTVRSQLSLNTEQAQRLASGEYKLLLYCGLAQAVFQGHPTDIAFPNQIEVKVNDDDVKHSYKGLKNKPGSTKPADITPKIRAKANYPNQVTVTYALTTKRYAYCIYMARNVSAALLTERIKAQNVISKDQVIREMRRVNADPDIEATSTRMSLRDPVSTVRITLPVRSTVCSHTQCFDGAMFMQLVEQAPQWNCPVCSKTLTFSSLCVDKYFEDILNRTPSSIEKVDVEPDGQWRMIQEEDENTNGAAGKARAPYDDDFDDDIVELDGPQNKTVNGVKMESQPPTGPQTFSFNTPPLSSREPSVAQSTVSAARTGNKRASNAIIDLTLSDDEEQPPRPAKRHAPASSNQGTTSSSHPPQQPYHTPSSLPDHSGHRPAPLPPPSRGIQQADNYRPLSSENFRPSPNSEGFGVANGDSFRPGNYSGGLHVPGSPRGGSFQSPFSNGNLPSNPQSPAQRGSPFTYSARPPPMPWQTEQYARPSASSRQPSNTLLPFSIRPPPSPTALSHSGIQSPQNHQGGIRLPPMQTKPPSGPALGTAYQSSQDNFFQNGWRSDERYSDSPN